MAWLLAFVLRGCGKPGEAKECRLRYFYVLQITTKCIYSKTNLPEFITRYNAIKSGYPALSQYYGDYAGSDQKLDAFAKRYFALKASNPDLSKYFGDYAAGHNMLMKKKTSALK